MLLSHSAMTALTCISNFISLDKRTEAHSEPIILSEIKLFMDTVNKKYDQHGDLWPYHRVLYPEDGDLNANFSISLLQLSFTITHMEHLLTNKL